MSSTFYELEEQQIKRNSSKILSGTKLAPASLGLGRHGRQPHQPRQQPLPVLSSPSPPPVVAAGQSPHGDGGGGAVFLGGGVLELLAEAFEVLPHRGRGVSGQIR